MVILHLILLILFSPFALALDSNLQLCENKKCVNITLPAPDLYKARYQPSKAPYYRIEFTKNDCNINNCWLYLGEVADSLRVFVNTKLIYNSTNKNNYPTFIKQEAIHFQIPPDIIKEHNEIIIYVHDLNQTLWGLKSEDISFGDYQKIYFKSFKDWSKRTGITIFSASIQLFFSLLLLVSFLLLREIRILHLLLYSIIATIYLISLSEYPRQFINPIMASGPIHFSLRLTYDFFFFKLVENFFIIKPHQYTKLSFVYPFFITILISSWFLGFHNYNHYQTIMFVAAFFILFPPLLIFLIKDFSAKRQYTTTAKLFFAFIALLTLNDLLFFWQILPTGFSVKFFTPFVTLFFLIMLVYEASKKTLEVAIINRYLFVARQVAHDIRSPLASLDMVISTTKDIPHDQKRIIGHALRRIHDIANNLLETSRKNSNHVNKKVSLLVPIIDSILSEKRTELRKYIHLSLDFNSNINNIGIFTKADNSELKRVLSNLINNAVEATPNATGKITIDVRTNGKVAIIQVIDNGIGIPKDILTKIFKENISYNKQNGNGIGLSSAKETIESFGGTIIIESTINKGTTVTITLPLAPTPKWFLNELHIARNTQIAVIDDDRTIHSLWNSRIGTTMQLNHLTQFDESLPSADLYLVDYEFQNQTYNGLDKIIELNLKNAILVTSHYDETLIQEKAASHNIKIIPKDILHLIPIIFDSTENYDLVLIDDDELIRLSWETKAKLENTKILTVTNYNELENKIATLHFSTKFYIDSELGDGPKGEEIAKKLFDLGYKELYLCTGHSPDHFKNMYWIKGIQGKHFPI